MKPEDILKPHILTLEQNLRTLVDENANELRDDILGLLFAKSKRIRPIFTYLCTLALNEKIDKDIDNLALALELLHSATLVHDDVLDESKIRRENKSFYYKFGSKKAVVIGDYLLSLCLLTLSKINNPEIFSIFSQNIVKTINGEINQFQKRFEFTNESEYLQKSSLKTANLFVCAAQSVCVLKNAPNEKRNSLAEFALRLGTVFQMRNDIDNFKNAPDDIKNGIYTLPLIYFKQENPSCDIIDLKEETLLKYIKKADKKADEMINRSILNLDKSLNSDAYRMSISLIEQLRG